MPSSLSAEPTLAAALPFRLWWKPTCPLFAVALPENKAVFLPQPSAPCLWQQERAFSDLGAVSACSSHFLPPDDITHYPAAVHLLVKPLLWHLRVQQPVHHHCLKSWQRRCPQYPGCRSLTTISHSSSATTQTWSLSMTRLSAVSGQPPSYHRLPRFHPMPSRTLT